ncbi:MAG TPA: hypothetical protein VGC63_04850 [Solirubrobacterales bacterium]|jgi:hypothetical protein
MKKLWKYYPAIASTLALAIALTGATAAATGVFVTSKQIKNGTILTQDIHKNGVKSSDIGTDAVKSADIGTGQVGTSDIGEGQVAPQDVTMPAPNQLQEGDTASATVGSDFAPVDIVGTYAKQDPTSLLEVDWTGTAGSGFSPCVFQLRVDGQPSAVGAGDTYVGSGAVSVSATSLFSGLAAGPHQIEIWGRITIGGGAQYPCTVGPASAGISQTLVVSEQVV